MDQLGVKTLVRTLKIGICLLIGIQSAAGAPLAVSAQTPVEEPGINYYLPLVLNGRPAPTPTPTPDPDPTEDMSTSWYMAGGNPQRTSQVASSPDNQTGLYGVLKPVWYRVIDPYINPKYQLVTAYDTIYVSTAKGIYALSTNDIDGNGVGGDIRWVYPTKLPIGHSPTAVNGVLYVPGDDHRIHAIEASPDTSSLPIDPTTGYKINNKVKWIFEAVAYREPDGSVTLGAGFDTNPLVIKNTVYVGNRNGYMYALNATTGVLRWRFRTEGPILFSPAASKDGSRIYFASNDAFAYALNAADGALIWKTGKLPGAGFFAYWPVVYTDMPGSLSEKEYVIFTGSSPYSMYYFAPPYYYGDVFALQTADLYNGIEPYEYIGPTGAEPGLWISGTTTVDASRIVEYYEEPGADEIASDPLGLSRSLHKPWRRSYFVLDGTTGTELTLDPDQDGKAGYAPIAFAGSRSGNRYPPVLGGDGVLYQFNGGVARPHIPIGEVTGWKFGTQYLSVVGNGWGGWDEPEGYSVGGNVLYTYHNRDVFSEAIDLASLYPNNRWTQFNMNLGSLVPGYREKYVGDAYGTLNGVYSNGGTRVGPTPYKGMVYYMASNSIIAFGQAFDSAVHLPIARGINVDSPANQITLDELKHRLASEVQMMVKSGHLRAGYHSTGVADLDYASTHRNYLIHYFHRPADTFVALLRALPYLPTSPTDIRQQTRTYLQNEFSEYAYSVHIGYKDGVRREAFDAPPEIADAMSGYDADPYYSPDSDYADYQYRFYGLYLYAKEFGNAAEIFSVVKDDLRTPPPDSELLENPPVHNSYIAGYIGYLGLEQLAGLGESMAVRNRLEYLLQLRASNFTKDLAYTWEHPYNVSDNFINMVPELGDYLRLHALPELTTALNEYQSIAPYWFISKYDATLGEGALQHLYDYSTIFTAKSQILREPREELVKYLDVPAFAVGDLFYIHNLVSAIEAPSMTEMPITLQDSSQPLWGTHLSRFCWEIRMHTSNCSGQP